MRCKCTQHDVGLKWTHTRHILNELCCVLKLQLLIIEPEIKLPPAPGWSWKIFFKANSRKDLLILCMRLLLLHFLSLSQKHNTPSRVASQSLRVVKEGERRFYISIVPDLRRPLSLSLSDPAPVSNKCVCDVTVEQESQRVKGGDSAKQVD